jgi:hypothetical protein
MLDLIATFVSQSIDTRSILLRGHGRRAARHFGQTSVINFGEILGNRWAVDATRPRRYGITRSAVRSTNTNQLALLDRFRIGAGDVSSDTNQLL